MRHGLRERATVRTAEDAFDFLLTAGVGGIPFTAFAGHDPARFGTWQRLSYGSKDVSELGVFIDRVRDRIEQQGRLGSSAPRARLAAAAAIGRRTASGPAPAPRPATRRSTNSIAETFARARAARPRRRRGRRRRG